MKCGVVAGVLVAMTAPATAEDPKPPDRSAIDAGEANLESQALRKGVVFTLAFGGAITLGFGGDDNPATQDNQTGRGAAATLRLAHVASPRTMITFEVTGGALFYSINAGDMKKTYTTEFQSYLVGAQFYAKPAVWFRAGLGFGRHNGENVDVEGTPRAKQRFRYPGPASSFGVGIDLVRVKWFRFGVELTSTASINRAGLLSSSGFLLGFSAD